MPSSNKYLGLDIGSVRVGVATAESSVRIAVPYDTIPMNEETFAYDIASLVSALGVTHVIVGYPRNQSGESTDQSRYTEARVDSLNDLPAKIIFQDESVTSLLAEQRIKSRNEPATKEAIDAEAAAIILQDYLEAHT